MFIGNILKVVDYMQDPPVRNPGCMNSKGGQLKGCWSSGVMYGKVDQGGHGTNQGGHQGPVGDHGCTVITLFVTSQLTADLLNPLSVTLWQVLCNSFIEDKTLEQSSSTKMISW